MARRWSHHPGRSRKPHYLPADTSVGVVVIDGVLQVICTSGSGEPVTMREFTDWARYTVHRAAA